MYQECRAQFEAYACMEMIVQYVLYDQYKA